MRTWGFKAAGREKNWHPLTTPSPLCIHEETSIASANRALLDGRTFMAGSALPQGMLLTIPPPGSTLSAGGNITVQVSMEVSNGVAFMHLLFTLYPGLHRKR